MNYQEYLESRAKIEAMSAILREMSCRNEYEFIQLLIEAVDTRMSELAEPPYFPGSATCDPDVLKIRQEKIQHLQILKSKLEGLNGLMAFS